MNSTEIAALIKHLGLAKDGTCYDIVDIAAAAYKEIMRLTSELDNARTRVLCFADLVQAMAEEIENIYGRDTELTIAARRRLEGHPWNFTTKTT